MLIPVFDILLGADYTPAMAWLCRHFNADSVYARKVIDDCLEIEFERDDGSMAGTTLSSSDLVQLLHESEHVALAVGTIWFLLVQHDVYDETNELIHSFLERFDIAVEKVPFFVDDSYLVLECEPIKGKSYISDKDLIITVDSDTLRVEIPLQNESLRNLLISRLRRIEA